MFGVQFNLPPESFYVCRSARANAHSALRGGGIGCLFLVEHASNALYSQNLAENLLEKSSKIYLLVLKLIMFSNWTCQL